LLFEFQGGLREKTLDRKDRHNHNFTSTDSNDLEVENKDQKRENKWRGVSWWFKVTTKYGLKSILLKLEGASFVFPRSKRKASILRTI
jgi:hypothetical protein